MGAPAGSTPCGASACLGLGIGVGVGLGLGVTVRVGVGFRGTVKGGVGIGVSVGVRVGLEGGASAEITRSPGCSRRSTRDTPQHPPCEGRATHPAIGRLACAALVSTRRLRPGDEPLSNMSSCASLRQASTLRASGAMELVRVRVRVGLGLGTGIGLEYP